MAHECQYREVDFFEIRYYNPNRITLSLIGLWPYTKPKERFIRTVILSFILLLLLILQVVTMIKVDNPELLTEVVSNFLVYVIGVFIYYNSVLNMPKIHYLLELLKHDWLEAKTTKQLEIMKEYAETGRTYALILFVSAYGLIFLATTTSTAPIILDVISPLNKSRPRVLPFPLELFLDLQEHFFLSLFINVFLMSSFCMVSLSNYMVFMVAVQYICGAFRVVGCMLDDVIDAKTASIQDHNSEDRIYGMIVRSIKYHKRTLEFVRVGMIGCCIWLREFDFIFNSIFEHCLIVVISVTVLFIVTAFLRLLQNDAFESTRMRETAVSFANVILHCGTLYITSNMGQKIIDHSVSLFDKAYEIPWYVLSSCKKSQTLVWFIMMRSLKPCCITIANFFILSVKLCASIIQTGLSYAMIIYSLR